MSSAIAVIDTCSLFPLALRDILLRAAEAGLYRVRWSNEILDELGRNLREERGLSDEQAQHLLAEMRGAFPEATITGYEQLIRGMTNPVGDRHVLAAAVHGGAQLIITDNLKDFPESALGPYNLEAQSSDEFLGYLFGLYPDRMARIVIEMNADRVRNPEALWATLERLAKSAPDFVGEVIKHEAVSAMLDEEGQTN